LQLFHFIGVNRGYPHGFQQFFPALAQHGDSFGIGFEDAITLRINDKNRII